MGSRVYAVAGKSWIAMQVIVMSILPLELRRGYAPAPLLQRVHCGDRVLRSYLSDWLANCECDGTQVDVLV